MDSITHLYKSKMRLYRDRPDILVAGRWYWCPPGAIAIPYSHRFGSYTGDSSSVEIDPEAIGEVAHWDGPNYLEPNPRYTGQHWCGSKQDWEQGPLYSSRPAHTDSEGIPFCCNSSPLRPGGALISGQGDVGVIYAITSQAEQLDTGLSVFGVSIEYAYTSQGEQLDTGLSVFTYVVPSTVSYWGTDYFGDAYFGDAYYG